MYNRIFNVSASFRYQLYLASFLVTGWWIGCTVATLTNCIPLKWSWLNSLADSKYCFDYNIFWMASGAVEIFLDAVILAMPISVVVRMQLSLKRRLTIIGIFLLGGLYVSPLPLPVRSSTRPPLPSQTNAGPQHPRNWHRSRHPRLPSRLPRPLVPQN
jgi:hypothetical protein